MRFGRIATPEGMCFCVVEGAEGAEVCREIAGTPFTEPELTGREWKLADVRLLAPMLPSKIVAIGRNYADHVKEVFQKSAEHLPPTLFLKPPTAAVGPGAAIKIPEFATKVEFEGELALVIGQACKNVKAENWKDVVLGFTIINDVSSRDLQFADGQWARAKGIDTFAPLGPWIETDLDYSDLRIVTRLDGQVVQDGSTALMIHTIPDLIAYASAAFTLLPGDVILTGTPEGVGKVDAGQRVEVEIEGI
ncbi:MAG: fumarylacetoacetate hydrolase family protein, partial [Tetrasphaera sp.]|nr:fumarylacetoacetate hydrolase family protein [Tetrasphaera sp.]